MTSEKTPWFVNGEKPAYVGVYEVRVEMGRAYSYWDGKSFNEYLWFSSCGMGPQDAYEGRQKRKHGAGHQKMHWRGLKKNPNARAALTKHKEV